MSAEVVEKHACPIHLSSIGGHLQYLDNPFCVPHRKSMKVLSLESVRGTCACRMTTELKPNALRTDEPQVKLLCSHPPKGGVIYNWLSMPGFGAHYAPAVAVASTLVRL
jgi:hypothetical protein